MAPGQHGDQQGGDSRDERLTTLYGEYIDRLNRGERLDPEQILANHPDVGAALVERLEAFQDVGEELEKDGALGVLGDYRLLRQVGRGGMGVVYEAWQNSMERHVALKVLPGGFAADTKAVTRFVREAQVAGKLNHPNIVAVYGMGIEDKTPYYAMELVAGETLAEVLRRSRVDETSSAGEERSRVLSTDSGLFGEALPEEATQSAGDEPGEITTTTPRPAGSSQSTSGLEGTPTDAAYFRRVAESFAAVAEGLEHAHQQGIIHRDIKPSNLIVGPDGQLRILDFGLARVEGEQSLTVTGDFLGTVMYVSPEQAMTRRVPLDHRTDLYSLGATMYEVLTWEPPFKGKTPQDTLGQIIFQDPRPPRRANPRIPRNLETIVLKCLRKDPRDRYGTAEALAQDLERFARGAPIEARPQPRWERVSRKVWRQKLRVAVAALFVVLLVALGHFLLGPPKTTVRLVWTAPPEAHVNTVSRDGRYLSYVDRTTGDLAIRDLTSGENHPLTSRGSWTWPQEYAQWSVFSPDGKQIAYSWVNDESFYELRVASRKGSAPWVLYRDKEEAEFLWPAAWSPGGEQVLAVLQKNQRTKIALMPLAGGSPRILKSFPSDPWNVDFSPDGEFIAYEIVPPKSRQCDIFLLAADGSRETPLVKGLGQDSLLNWAADGSGIVFVSDRRQSGTFDAWFLHVAGGKPRGEPRLLKRGLGDVERAGWARNGGQFYTTRYDTKDVYVATLDFQSGEVLESPVTASSLTIYSLQDWAPDGEHLAYFRRGWDEQISIRNIKTDEERQLSPQVGWLRWIRWSPDGLSFVAALRGSKERERGIYTIDARTGDPTLVVPGDVASPAWSPDGQAIFYQLAAEGRKRLIRRELEGGREQEVIPELWREHYAVSPDGEAVAYTEAIDEPWTVILKVVPVAGGDAREIFRVHGVNDMRVCAFTRDGRHVLALVKNWYNDRVGRGLWRIPVEGGEPLRLSLSMRSLDDLRIHPDGKQIAFTASGAMTEVWTLENFLPAAGSR